MFFFVVRRLLVSIPIVLASTFLMFGLVTISGDPLAELRQSRNPNKEQQIAQMKARLQLDRPFQSRYFDWLRGVLHGDFGLNREGQDVSALLRQAMSTTFRLIILATVLSIVIGVLFGIITAVRQYSLIDYSSTFAAFLFFSLPVFWLAVLLKEFGAIRFNDYLEAPGISVSGAILLGVIAGVFFGGLTPGSLQRRAIVAVGSGVGVFAIMLTIEATDWLLNPGFSLPFVVVVAIAAGIGSALLFAPLSNRQVLAAGIIAGLAAVVGSQLLSSWVEDPTWTQMLILLVLTIATGAVVGLVVGGAIDRRPAMSAGMSTAFIVANVVCLDQFLSAWQPGRTIATIGPKSPNLDAPFWETMVDYAGHQVLPTLSLALIGFATFMRFTRSSMLETLKSDYVRTAKAKGLPATQVIMRHAFRTALIPVMTVVTISFATVIEGAVITERVFAWKGMGSLFIEGLLSVDPYPVMGFLLVVSVSIVLLNALADIMYAYLDPRIRR